MKLQFGVDKCHQIHIGKSSHTCPDLFIDNWKLEKKNEMDTGIESLEDVLEDEAKMEKVNSDKYLGDIITADGTNDKNVKARTDKGYGIIDQLIDIFRDYSFGPSFFQVAVMFRNSMFINAILCNSEVWYNLSEANMYQPIGTCR